MTAIGLGLSALPNEIVYGAGPDDSAKGDVPGASANPFTGTGSKFGDRLLAFIPGEVVGGYVAAIAIAPKDSQKAAWTLLAIFTVLAGVLVFLTYLAKARKIGVNITRNSCPWFRILAAITAFLAWSIALPTSPFDRFFEESWIKAVILSIVAILIAAIAPVFDPASATA